MLNRIYVPVLSIRHKLLLEYYKPDSYGIRSRSVNERCISEVREKAYEKGVLTKGAVKRLKKSIELLLDVSPWKRFLRPVDQSLVKYRITFITLTLSALQDDITDKEIYDKVFKPFLQWLRRSKGVQSYVWKAERQKNGNLHYHITTNEYVDYREIRSTWNKYQNRLGFIDRFKAQHGHRDPNSTDVHSVQKIRNLSAYMVKYMCKLDKNAREIGHKVWDCSKNLKRTDWPEYIIDNRTSKELEQIRNGNNIEVVESEQYRLTKEKNGDIRKWLPERIKDEYRIFVDEIKNGTRKEERKQIATAHAGNEQKTGISTHPGNSNNKLKKAMQLALIYE